MTKLPGPNDVPMMSQAAVDDADPEKLAKRYYEATGKNMVAENLMKPWHPDLKREESRSYFLPGYSELIYCLSTLGISVSFNDAPSVQSAIQELVKLELEIAGWRVVDSGCLSLRIMHPKTPRPKPWYKKWLP